MPDAFSERDYQRFGFSLLQEHGYHVEVWSFIHQFIENATEKYQTRDPSSFAHHRTFPSKKEAIKAVESLSGEDIVMFLIPCSLRSYWLYKAVSNSQAPYGIVNPNALPAVPQSAKSYKKLILHPLSTLKKIPTKFFSYLPLQKLGIKVASFALVGGRQSLYYYKKIIDEHTKIVWAHALDFDVYLKFQEEVLQNPLGSRYAVFIDQYLPYHPDYWIVGKKNTFDAKAYYGALNSAFDSFEKSTGMNVVIAAHPRASYEDKPHCFGTRPIFYGNLLSLVKHSECVLAHYSTGLNFANLYEKSVVFLYNDEMVKEAFSFRATCEFGRRFGKEPIKDFSNVDWEKELRVDREKYEAYREDFIKVKDSSEKNTWLIFVDFLKGQTRVTKCL